MPALALRPQLFGMVCFVAVAWLLSVRRTTPRALWLAPVVVLLWANLHGSFFLGPVLIGLAWLQDLHDRDPGARRTLLALIASAVATCLTPFGPAVWVYAAGLTADPEVTSRVSEWQPTSIHDVAGVLFFASALAVVAIVARRGRVVPWPSLVGPRHLLRHRPVGAARHRVVGPRGCADRRDAGATRGRRIRRGRRRGPCGVSTSSSPG